MDREYYTFLIFRRAHSRLRKIHRFPYLVRLIRGSAIAGVVTAGTLANSYARMLLRFSDYNTLRTHYSYALIKLPMGDRG